jgi:HlyD family secretion protein
MKVADKPANSAVSPLVRPPVPPGVLPSVTGRPAKKRKVKKWILAAATLVSLAAIGVSIYSWKLPKTEYVTAQVDRGDIDSTVTTTGNLNAVITVQVGSQVSGNILALYADFNTKVKKGQLVALIDPAPFQAAVDQAKAAVNSAKAVVLTARVSIAKSQSDLANAVANVASQQANIVKAQSAVDLAKVQADRRLTLIRLDATSKEDYDTAKANYDQALASADAAKAALNAMEASAESAKKGIDVARAQLQQAEAIAQENTAALAQAQLNLDHTRIIAPVDGTIQSRNMDVGQTVAASFQAPVIFLIAQDLTKMQVDTNVGEADVASIRLDQQANFTVDAYPGQIFSGRVWQIRLAPINVQNVITYDVVIAVSNPDLRLFPGMTANATILTGHASNALRIPKSALRFHLRAAPGAGTQSARAPVSNQRAAQPGQQMQTIYVLDDRGQPKATRVSLGVTDPNYVQVLGGSLLEGQKVVVGMKGPPAGTAAAPATGGSTRRFGF